MRRGMRHECEYSRVNRTVQCAALSHNCQWIKKMMDADIEWDEGTAEQGRIGSSKSIGRRGTYET